MLHPQTYALLEKLKAKMKDGSLTPVDRVGPGTLVCITQATAHGILYHQLPFDSAPADWATLLREKPKGWKLGELKIVAIFDMWPEMSEKERPPVEVFDN